MKMIDYSALHTKWISGNVNNAQLSLDGLTLFRKNGIILSVRRKDYEWGMIFLKQQKRTIRNKLLSLCMSILFTICMVPLNVIPAAAAGGSCGNGTTWEFNNGVLTLSGSGMVTMMNWANYADQVTSVVVGDGITAIQSGLFSNNSVLKSVQFGKSLESVPSSFCMNCTALSSVTIPEGVKSVGNNAFQNCKMLKNIELPSTVTTIGERAFYSCVGLTELTLPDSVTTIEKGAFSENNIKRLKLGKNLTTIGSEAFLNSCFSEVEIPDSVTSIGTDAFGYVYSSITRSGGSLNHYSTGNVIKVTIIGKEGGTAQKFAEAGGFPFKTPGSASHTHSWSNWTVKVKAGCETAGEQIRTCSGCGETETKSISATGHSWSEWKTESAASCEKDGTSARTCSLCQKKETQSIPATGHNWGEWKTETAASCEKDGTSARTCSSCHQKETKSISATGHNWGEWTIKKQPTVDAAGEQESVCADCGMIRTTEIAALVGYQLSVAVSEGGSVTPSGETKVAEGSNVTLKIAANQGWELASVYVNGKEMRPDSSGEILLTGIRSNQNISVVFQQKEQPKTRKCNFIDITPQRVVWLTDAAGLSMKDFMISANISDKGMVSWLDVTADCVPDLNGMPESSPYGTGTVRFRYQGNDDAVKDYFRQNSFTAQIPLYLRGDGDGSGKVDVIDAELALNSYVVRLSGSDSDGISEVQRTVMDVDENGEMSLEDAAYILQYYTQDFVGLKPDWKTITGK